MHMIWQRYSVAAGTAGVAAAFCGRFGATFFVALREAFTGAFFTAFLAAGACLAADFVAAFFAAHRFFKAATIAALPAAESFRFGFEASGATGDGSDSFLASAHRFRCASPMRFRTATLIFRRLPVGAFGAAAASVGPPWSIWRSSAI